MVAAAEEHAGAPPRLLAFEGEDGPAGTLAASVTWTADGAARVGIEADRALDGDPHGGVRGPLAHLDSGSSTLELGRRSVPVVALVGALLARTLRTATRELGGPPPAAVLPIPSGWPPDGRRARALRAAAALGGLTALTLVPAAIAAAELVRGDEAGIVLVCDVGGRSCQLSLVDLDDGDARLMATTELAIGADLFDELLYLDVLRELGEREPAAAHRLEELHQQPSVAGADAETARWARCQAELARAVRHCREALTDAGTSTLAIAEPVGVALAIERDRVCDLLLTEAQILAGAAREQLAQASLAGARPSDRAGRVRCVLLGGGALTPGLGDALAAELDVPVTTAADPVTAVARGALTASGRQASAPRRAPAQRAPVPQQRPAAPPRQTVRTVLEDVVAAALSGGEIVAVVRHDAHHRVVRLDVAGRVGAAHGLDGAAFSGVTVTPAAVVVSGAAGAAVLSADLRPLAAIERALLAAACGASVWIVSAGEQQTPVLELTTLAVEGRDARVVASQRLGLVATPSAGRLARRSVARAVPPDAHGSVAGGRLRFAVPARGRGGRPAQRVGEADRSGLGPVQTRTSPAWVAGQAVAPGGGVVTLAAGAGASQLVLAETQLASWPAGVHVRLVAHEPLSPWVVAGRQARWEVLRLDGERVTSVRAGDGAIEGAEATAGGLWLVSESAGRRRLMRLAPDGELQRVAELGGPIELVGRAGQETLLLAGRRGAPRTLVAVSAAV